MPSKRLPAIATAALLVSGAAVPNAAAAEIKVTRNAKHGAYLTDGQGRALYTFSSDRIGNGTTAPRSVCHDACASAWPPMTVESKPQAGAALDGSRISAMKRDGTRQAVYGGAPLYYFTGDAGRGQATGHGVKAFGGTWRLAQATGAAAAAAKNLFADVILKSPECVRYDRKHNRYLVSNINGKMRQADNNGFISLVTSAGVVQDRWIAGGQDGVTLNAPKGMEIHGDTLFVADIDHLRMFDLATGKPAGSIEIEGAKFLNGLAIASDGTIYVTDSGTKNVPGAIFRVAPDHSIATIAEGRDLHRPNGIAFDSNGDLVTVTYGSNLVITLSTDGRIHGKRQLPAGQLDGLLVQDDGSMLVSSWKGKNVVRIAPDGAIQTVLTGLVEPAAFDVDRAHSRLLVPQVKANAIAVAPVSGG